MAAESNAVRLRHPNQERASAKATKAVITILLIASAVLTAVVLIGGWTNQAGARWLTTAYVIVYAIIAYYVFFQWKRGVLALSAGLALIFASMLAPGIPGWFERAKPGYEIALIPPGVIGLIVVLIVVLQMILVVASIVGFQQGWNLEIEERTDRHEDEGYYEDDDDYGSDDGHHDDPDHDGDGYYADDETSEHEAVPAGTSSSAAGGEAAEHDGAAEGESESGTPPWMDTETERHRAAAADEEAGSERPGSQG